MKIVGINFTTTNGIKKYTLHITDAFEPYYMNAESGRGCVGEKVESIYVGEQDCSQLKIGDEIEIIYGKAITIKGHIYQPIKRSDILN